MLEKLFLKAEEEAGSDEQDLPRLAEGGCRMLCQVRRRSVQLLGLKKVRNLDQVELGSSRWHLKSVLLAQGCRYLLVPPTREFGSHFAHREARTDVVPVRACRLKETERKCALFRFKKLKGVNHAWLRGSNSLLRCLVRAFPWLHSDVLRGQQLRVQRQEIRVNYGYERYATRSKEVLKSPEIAERPLDDATGRRLYAVNRAQVHRLPQVSLVSALN